MLSIDLDRETQERLDRVAKSTGRTMAACAEEAILELLDDLEDVRVAKERLRSPGQTFSAEEVKRALDV